LPKSILIVAHPGHELRIFHWLERERPEVSILTDGSGGQASSRTAYSSEVLAAAGASRGPVFGEAPDRAWYDAILRRDASPFIQAAQAIAASAGDEPEIRVVGDAVDGYNPVHDLANAVAAAVAARLGRSRTQVSLLASPAVPMPGSPALTIRLDEAALARKLRAVDAYLPLAEEARRMRERVAADIETLHESDFAWPPEFEPEWERFARERVAAGVYDRAITYRDHVRPLALRVIEALAAED
jgi:hypothetical protein